MITEIYLDSFDDGLEIAITVGPYTFSSATFRQEKHWIYCQEGPSLYSIINP